MTSENYRVPLLHYVKLCASSQTPRWLQTGVTARKCSIRVKIGDFLSHVTLKFDGWPWKTIGHLFYVNVASSFWYHLIAISEFKLKFTVWKHSIWVKIGDFLSRVTLKFDGWPWKTIWHLFYVTLSFVHHFVAINDEFQLELQSGNAQFASKSTIFLAVWPWSLTDDLEKEASCIISSSYANSNWSYSPETAKLGYDLCDLDLWPMTLTLCMDITSVIGSLITPENFVMIRWWEHSQKCVTDRQTDGRTDRLNHS